MKKHINNTNFKVIVFDLNGTIINRISDHPKHIEYRNKYIESKTGNQLEIDLPNSTSLALEICGLNPIAYYIVRNSDINWEQFHQRIPELNTILKGFKSIGYKLVIYTDCLSEQVKATLRILKLDNVFDFVLTGEYNMCKPNPKAFQYIADKFDCSINEVLMVGNDLNKDLLPLQYLGGNTIEIEDQSKLPDLFNYIEELKQ